MSVLCLRCLCHSSDEDVCCSECGAPLQRPASLISVRERKREISRIELGMAEDLLSECAEGATKELLRARIGSARELFETAEQSVKELALPRRYVPWQAPKVGASSVSSVGQGWGKDPIDLAIDVLRPCVIGNNTLRVYVVANRGRFDDVTLKVKPHVGSCSELEQQCGDLFADDEASRDCERIFTIENLPAGTFGCDIVLRFAFEGVCRQYMGQIEVNVNRREDLLDVVRQNINIHYNPQTTIGNVSQASDVKVLHKSDAGICKALDGISNIENPMSVIDRMSRAGDRTYRRVSMKSMFGDGLQSPPSVAKVKEIEVRLGYNRVQFFVDEIICIGHSVDGVRYSDIVIDAPSGMNVSPYDRISRIHCMMRHYGEKVEICDGRVDQEGQIVPSSNGTVLNMERLPPRTTRPLRDGELCLGASSGAVKLGVRLVPAAGCEHCKIAKDERVSCAGGERPCVVISRPDVLNVKYVALWSCFDLGNINLDYKGIVIFHYNGAFGWRRGKRTGWLMSGENFGSSQFDKATVLKVWDR